MANTAKAETSTADSAQVMVQPANWEEKQKKKLSAYVDEIRDVNEELAGIAAKKKGILDRAEKEGFKRKGIVTTAKEAMNPQSDDDRETANRYLEAYGLLPLFQIAKKH